MQAIFMHLHARIGVSGQACVCPALLCQVFLLETEKQNVLS